MIWTNQELELLKRYYGREDRSVTAHRLNRSVYSTRTKAQRLGLRYAFLRRTVPKPSWWGTDKEHTLAVCGRWTNE